MIVPSDASKQVILICKSHHEEKDTLNALRKFVLSYTGNPPAYVTEKDVWSFLIRAAEEVLDARSFARLLTDAFRYRKSATLEDMMRELIGAISIVQVYEKGVVLVDLTLKEPKVADAPESVALRDK